MGHPFYFGTSRSLCISGIAISRWASRVLLGGFGVGRWSGFVFLVLWFVLLCLAWIQDTMLHKRNVKLLFPRMMFYITTWDVWNPRNSGINYIPGINWCRILAINSISYLCFWPHRPVRARFHGLFSVTGNHSNVKFFCIFSTCFRCMRMVSSCRRCKCIAPVTRNHFRYIRYTCPNLWCNPCSKCYRMACFGTYSTHVQTCDATRVQNVTEWTASVHTSHMSRPVIGYYRTERKNALGHKPCHWCDIEQDNGWLRWKNETPARPYGTMDRCFFPEPFFGITSGTPSLPGAKPRRFRRSSSEGQTLAQPVVGFVWPHQTVGKSREFKRGTRYREGSHIPILSACKFLSRWFLFFSPFSWRLVGYGLVFLEGKLSPKNGERAKSSFYFS